MGLKLKYEQINDWHMNVSETKPEISCISGPYVQQLILREVSNNSKDCLMNSFWTEHHDQHWDHPPRGSLSRTEVKDALNLIEELKEDYTFTLQTGLRFRKEKRGLVVAKDHNVYFINDKGLRFLELFGDRVTVGDVQKICRESGETEEVGLDFLKKLIIFGVLRWIQ